MVPSKRLAFVLVMTVVLLEKNKILLLANAEMLPPKQCTQYTNVTENLRSKNGTVFISTKLISATLCSYKQSKSDWYRFKYRLNAPFSLNRDFNDETKFLGLSQNISCPRYGVPEHPCRVYETITSKLCFEVSRNVRIGRSVNVTNCGSFYVYQLLQFTCKEDASTLKRWKLDNPRDDNCNIRPIENSLQKRDVKAAHVICDTGWKPFGKSCYNISSAEGSWSDAKSDCELQGAHLLKIDDEDEQNYFTTVLGNMDSTLWIGLHDPTNNQKWQWESDGSYANHTNWNDKKFCVHKSATNCVQIHTGKKLAGFWSEHPCREIRKYICEKKGATTTTTTTTTTAGPIRTAGKLIPTTTKRIPTIGVIGELEKQIDELKRYKSMSGKDQEKIAQMIIDELTNFTDFRGMDKKARKKGINSKDLGGAVRILKKIVDLNITARNLNILGPANNILDGRNVKSWKNLTNDTVSNHLITTLEKYGFQYGDNLKNTLNASGIIKYPNLQLHARYIKEGGEFLRRKSLFMLPNASFNLSSDALSKTSGTKVVVMWYKTMHHFINNSFNGSPIYGKVNSEILTASVQPRPPKQFEETVRITWNTMDWVTKTHNAKCVYWKPTLNETKWKKDGCRRIKNEKSDNQLLTCECNHLTAFAFIDISRNLIDEQKQHVLELISTIGCSISLVGIFLTILTYALLWKRLHQNTKSSIPSRVLMHLCVAIGMTDIFSILAGPARNNEEYCTAVSILLYFFILAVFGWMLCEGIVIYFQLVNVYTGLGLGGRHLKYLYLIGWGIPVVIAAALVGANDRSDFITERACWCGGGGAIFWTFVATIGLILLTNIVIFILALRSALSASHVAATSKLDTLEGSTSTTKASADEVLRKVKVGLRGSAVLIPLLGLTWVFGLLVFNEETIVFKYLFAICNSLQGVMIFVFHVVFNRKVHLAISRERKARKKARNYGKTMVSHTESITLQTSESSPSNQAFVELEHAQGNQLLQVEEN